MVQALICCQESRSYYAGYVFHNLICLELELIPSINASYVLIYLVIRMQYELYPMIQIVWRYSRVLNCIGDGNMALFRS